MSPVVVEATHVQRPWDRTKEVDMAGAPKGRLTETRVVVRAACC